MFKKSLLALTMLSCNAAFSQDVITTKSGNDFTVTIVSIEPSIVTYQLHGSPDSSVKTMPKSDVFRISYANGTKQTFSESETQDIQNSQASEMRLKGELDAEDNYKGYRGANTATLVTTLAVGPLLGLIPAIACSSTPPDIKRLNYHNAALMKNSDYKYAYEEKARKIKSKKTWTSYGIGAAVCVIAYIAVSAVTAQ